MGLPVARRRDPLKTLNPVLSPAPQAVRAPDISRKPVQLFPIAPASRAFYRRFFPDDVDGTVPYVAPISFGAPDTRYDPFFDTVGTDTCRQAVRDAATEMLAHRRAAMEQRAQQQATDQGYQYTRVLLGPAVESAIDSLEWSFWQYYGITFCTQVPATTATAPQAGDSAVA